MSISSPSTSSFGLSFSETPAPTSISVPTPTPAPTPTPVPAGDIMPAIDYRLQVSGQLDMSQLKMSGNIAVIFNGSGN